MGQEEQTPEINAAQIQGAILGRTKYVTAHAYNQTFKSPEN
jgi:hypothetical protein